MNKTPLQKSVEHAERTGSLNANDERQREKALVKQYDDAICQAMHVMLVKTEQNLSDVTFMASYDTLNREGIMRRERHECDVTDNGNQYLNKTLEIAYFTIGVTELPNEQGEFAKVPITTLECTNGDLLNLFSAPALRCFIGRLRTHILDGPLGPNHPITLVLVARETKGARRMYWLERPT